MDTTDAPQIIELEHKTLNYTPNDVKWLPNSAKYVVVGVTPSNTGIVEIREMDLMKEARATATGSSDVASVETNSSTASSKSVDTSSVLRRIVFPTSSDHSSGTDQSNSGIRCCHFGVAPSLNARHLAYGTTNGILSIMDLEHNYGSTTEMSSRYGSSTAPQDQSMSATKRGGGFVKKSSSYPPPPALWEVKDAHDGMINAMDGMGGHGSGRTGLSMGPPELVTGGRDGCVKVWDVRVDCSSRAGKGPQPVCSLEPDPTKITNPRDCWTVSFGNAHDEMERTVAAGFDNGDLKLFDLRTNRMIWETNIENAITCIEFDRPDIRQNKLLVTSLESRFHMYNLRTKHPKDGYTYKKELAHKSTVWCGKFSPHNRELFVTCGGNGGLNIYKYHYTASSSKEKSRHNKKGGANNKQPQKSNDGMILQTKKKHPIDGLDVGVVGHSELLNSRILSTQPINSFDWSPDQHGLSVMTSFDQTVRVQMITKLDKY